MASTKYNACHFNYIKLLIYVANFKALCFYFFKVQDISPTPFLAGNPTRIRTRGPKARKYTHYFPNSQVIA